MRNKPKHTTKDLQALGRPLTIFMIGVGVVLLVLEFILHRHGEIAAEDFPLFPAIFGFAAFLFIVQVGKWLRMMIMRKEDYYDD